MARVVAYHEELEHVVIAGAGRSQCVTVETAAWMLGTRWTVLRDMLRALPRVTTCDEYSPRPAPRLEPCGPHAKE